MPRFNVVRPVSVLGLVCALGLMTARSMFAQTGQTFIVNSTVDPGSGGCDATECTLREAITGANATPGLDTINFNVPCRDLSCSPVRTITLASSLPPIGDPVYINGASQPGFEGRPLIELDGSRTGGYTGGLYITAGESTVRALVINRFWRGIHLATKGIGKRESSQAW